MIFTAVAASAGPVDFGLAELNAAMAARNLKWKNKAELSLDPPESFRIEPYGSGGAYITGGDLRGLMYGLLEAADQIRATGRLAKAHGERAAPLRGVRIELDARLERAPEDFWRAYFQMLARNRFSRAHVVFPRLLRPYRTSCILSRAAADYGVDFTLGVAGEISAGEMGVLLGTCPAVRTLAIEPRSASRAAVLEAAQHAGRLVTIDPDSGGSLTENEFPLVALLRPAALWPPSFEVRAPLGAANEARSSDLGSPGSDAEANLDPARAADHAAFYWVWGRLGYDPKTKPPKEANAAEYETARLAALYIAAAGLAADGGSDHVASAPEAVRNVKRGVASAKFTPLDLAARLESAAAMLETSSVLDFQTIAIMAKETAGAQRASYARALHEAELSESVSAARPGASSAADSPAAAVPVAGNAGAPNRDHDARVRADRSNVFYASATSTVPVLPRPQMLHKPNQATSSDQPLIVTLHLSLAKPPAPKPASSKASSGQLTPGQLTPGQPTLVRLHYRTLDPQAKEMVLEEQPSADVHFTIPGSDLTGTWDLFYYFEVLNAEGSGWFEPDPLTAPPYFTVHIQAPRTGPN